jgi:hypothetical protein
MVKECDPSLSSMPRGRYDIEFSLLAHCDRTRKPSDSNSNPSQKLPSLEGDSREKQTRKDGVEGKRW